MNDIFRSVLSDIKAAAKDRGTTPEALCDQWQAVIDRSPDVGKLPHIMRVIPKTMRQQFGPQPQG